MATTVEDVTRLRDRARILMQTCNKQLAGVGPTIDDVQEALDLVTDAGTALGKLADDQGPLAGVPFASPAAEARAHDEGLTADDFKRRRRSSERGFTVDDVVRIKETVGEADPNADPNE